MDDETQLQYHKVHQQKSRNQPAASSLFAKATIFHTVCDDSLEQGAPNTEDVD